MMSTQTAVPRTGPPSIREYLAGERFDGTPLPIGKCNIYRERRGLPPLQPYAASQEPGLLTKAGNYIKAITRHVCNGAKKCTQEQIDARLAICRQCELYDAVKEICKKCGCCAGPTKSALTNKLAMASESCPHPDGPKWSAIKTE